MKNKTKVENQRELLLLFECHVLGSFNILVSTYFFNRL